MADVYGELTRIGLSDSSAEEITKAVYANKNAATKEDLAELKAHFHQEMVIQTRFILGTLVAMTAIFSAIVKLL